MQYILSFASCPSTAATAATALATRDLPSMKLGLVFSDAPEV